LTNQEPRYNGDLLSASSSIMICAPRDAKIRKKSSRTAMNVDRAHPACHYVSIYREPSCKLPV
jgi:hypothetical protein